MSDTLNKPAEPLTTSMPEIVGEDNQPDTTTTFENGFRLASGIDYGEAKPLPSTIVRDYVKALSDYTTTNHMSFFNQEVESISDLSLDEVRQRIITWAEALFGVDAEAARLRNKKTAAISVFQDKLKKLSETEKQAVLEQDKLYVVQPRKLANPNKKPKVTRETSTAKRKPASTLQDDMTKLFGDSAAEKLRKLMEG